MSRYIDAEKLYEFRKAEIKTNGYAANYVFGWNGAISKIENEAPPVISVAPVVRCAECKFFNRDDATRDGKCRCDYDKLWQVALFRPYRKFDDFCSRGAKMDEETNNGKE